MSVERLQPEAVVEDHGVAVDGERPGVDHHALVGGGDDRLLGGGEIEADVHLGVDLTAVIAVRASLREVREDLRVAGLDERAFPQRLVGGLQRDAPLLLLGELPLITVDREEAFHQGLVGRPLGEQLGDLGVEEGVADLDRVAAEATRQHLGRDPSRDGVPRLIGRRHRERGPARDIVGQREEADARALRAHRERREAERPDLGVGAHRITRADDHQAGSARQDVRRRRGDLERWRRQVDRRRERDGRALLPAPRAPEIVAGPDLDGGVALAESRRRRLERQRKLDFRHRGAVVSRDRDRLAALSHAHAGGRDTTTSRFDHDGERRLLTDEAGHARGDANAGHGLTPDQIGHRGE